MAIRFEPSFSPADLPNLIVWMDPLAEFVTLNGTDVSSWVPRAGNTAIDFVQSTDSIQPTYTGITINGHQAVEFEEDTDQRVVTVSTVDHGIGTGNFYQAHVIEPASPLNGMNHWFGWPGGGWSPAWDNTGTLAYWDNSVEPRFDTLDDVVAGTAYVIEWWRDGTSMRMTRNGVIDTDGRTSSQNFDTLNKLVIGSARDNGSESLDGTMGDVVFTSSLPSAEQRAQCRNFLGNKYGIVVR